MGLAYSFGDLVHHHGVEGHGGVLTDLTLERELRLPHLDQQAVGRELLGLALALETSKPIPRDTVLQQDHAS